MSILRAFAFNVFFIAWTGVLSVVYLLLMPLPWQALSSAVAFWARSTLWVLGWLVGLDHVVRGREHMPQGAAILAFKHESAWDTVAVNLLLAHPVVVLKRELFWLPVWGWLAWRCGMIFVDRSAGVSALKSMLGDARERLAQGRSVVIFPQGTRVAPGARRPYYPGVAALYDRLGLPVVPVALNSGLFWGRRAFLKRPGTIVVEFLPPIAPGLKRAEFMAELERRIETASDRLAQEAGMTTPKGAEK